MTKTMILCNCLDSQSVNGDAISQATGLPCSRVYSALCTDEIAQAANEIAKGDVIIACGQERARFEALAEEINADTPAFVDLRDRAGWSDGSDATAKMAALAAEATLAAPVSKSVDIVSEGTTLVVGASADVLPVAQALCDTLAVTVMLTDAQTPLFDPRFDMVRGRIKRAAGALGGFEMRLDALQQAIPGGRGDVSWTEARNNAQSNCDILIDLTGGQPLFPAPEKREGYLRADPKSQPAVAALVLQAIQLVGTFEKPLYIRLEESLCAHSRAEKPACSKCLNICPTGAITSAGEHVAIDPMICAGCGACSALCPSGAITYDAPPVETTFRRLGTLSGTYRKAGGTAPRLLVHDAEFGAEMIRLAARFGRGLPADVIPFETAALAGFGHAEMLAALGCGFAEISILLSPKTEVDTPRHEQALAVALSGGLPVRLLDVSEPDALSDALFSDAVASPQHDPILPMGSRRQVSRLVAKTLNPEATTLPLPAGAPYGAVVIDTQACTLCLSCVSLCPSGALGDNPDMPQLRFQEDACLQCGLCTNICPENAITLAPQMDLTDAALGQTVLHEEEPFACVECGALFGVKSTVEKIIEKLAGKHSMFATGSAARMIQMCDNCRINAQYHSENNPFASKERPRVRTTDDYFVKRKDH